MWFYEKYPDAVQTEKDGRKIAVSVIVEASGAGSKYAVPAAKKAFDAYFE